MSELELSIFRRRSHEARKQKARRGELFLGVAAGYVKAGPVRIEMDADRRIQDALKLVFAKFAEVLHHVGLPAAAARAERAASCRRGRADWIASATAQQQTAAGDVVFLYGDGSEAMTQPYLARAWAKSGADPPRRGALSKMG